MSDDDLIQDMHDNPIYWAEEYTALEAKLAAAEAAIPVWLDPYTNNGDRRPDTDYRHGWNDCRDVMLYAGDSHD